MAKQAITFESIMTSLQKKEYAPVYMLMGEEPYYIDKISDYIENNVLSEAEREFNQMVIYGKDVENMASVIAAAKRYPMMAPHQVIIIKEAQHISNYDDLVFYLQKPQPTTILVFCHKYKALDKRKKVCLELAKSGIVFESKKLYENQIPSFISNLLKTKQLQIELKAANMLAEFLGNDLERIVNEVDKLIASGKIQNNCITADLVEKNIGISKDYNNFELVNALAYHQVLKSNRIVDYFGKNKKNNPLILTISVLFNFFTNLLQLHRLTDKSQMGIASALGINPFFVKDYLEASRHYSYAKVVFIIDFIRETDAKSKGFKNASVGENDLLRELIFKILH
jgi:DNA polymerase III subunit delta